MDELVRINNPVRQKRGVMLALVLLFVFGTMLFLPCGQVYALRGEQVLIAGPRLEVASDSLVDSLEDSYDPIPQNATVLTLEKATRVSLAANGEEEKFFSFIPLENGGCYEFAPDSADELDNERACEEVFATLYRAEDGVIKPFRSGDDSQPASVIARLEAGKQYYLELSSESDEQLEFNIVVKDFSFDPFDLERYTIESTFGAYDSDATTPEGFIKALDFSFIDPVGEKKKLTYAQDYVFVLSKIGERGIDDLDDSAASDELDDIGEVPEVKFPLAIGDYEITIEGIGNYKNSFVVDEIIEVLDSHDLSNYSMGGALEACVTSANNLPLEDRLGITALKLYDNADSGLQLKRDFKITSYYMESDGVTEFDEPKKVDAPTQVGRYTAQIEGISSYTGENTFGFLLYSPYDLSYARIENNERILDSRAITNVEVIEALDLHLFTDANGDVELISQVDYAPQSSFSFADDENALVAFPLSPGTYRATIVGLDKYQGSSRDVYFTVVSNKDLSYYKISCNGRTYAEAIDGAALANALNIKFVDPFDQSEAAFVYGQDFEISAWYSSGSDNNAAHMIKLDGVPSTPGNYTAELKSKDGTGDAAYLDFELLDPNDIARSEDEVADSVTALQAKSESDLLQHLGIQLKSPTENDKTLQLGEGYSIEGWYVAANGESAGGNEESEHGAKMTFPAEPGQYTVVLNGEKPYYGKKELTFSIVDDTPIENVSVTGVQDNLYWNGEPYSVKPIVTSVSGDRLVEDEHYNVALYAASDLESPLDQVEQSGSFVMVLRAVEGGGYKGSKSIAFKVDDQNGISKASASCATSATELQAASPESLLERLGIAMTMPDGKQLALGDDYDVAGWYIAGEESTRPSSEMAFPAKAGAYVVLLKGKGEYRGEKLVTFTVVKDTPMETVAVEGACDVLDWDGKPFAVTPTVKSADKRTLVAGEHYTVALYDSAASDTSLQQVEKAGNYTLVINAVEGGGYVGDKRVTFKVEDPNDIAKSEAACRTEVTELQAKTAEALSERLGITVTMSGGKALALGADYEVAGWYVAPEGDTAPSADMAFPAKAGSYVVILKGVGEYHGEKLLGFKVVEDSEIGACVVSDVKNVSDWDGSAFAVAPRLTAPSGESLVENEHYTFALFAIDNPNVPLERVEFQGNYKVVISAIDGGGYKGETAVLFSVMSPSSEPINSYVVRWVDYGGTTVLYSNQVAEGTIPEYAGQTPSKESTVQNTFSFAGWTPEIAPVTSDVTYTATYSAQPRKYTISWLDDEGNLIDTTEVAYGEVPVHQEPAKESVDQHQYRFTGWTPEVTTVTGDATYQASFETASRECTVTWLMEDGSFIAADKYAFGETPMRDAPTKPSDAQFDYVFSGWAPEIASVVGDVVYTATFEPKLRQYAVTWMMDDGSVIDKAIVPYGEIPSHEDPTKESTFQYDYRFIGWSPEVSSVVGEAVYVAAFETLQRTYEITWLNEGGSKIASENYEYNVVPSREAPKKDGYVFTGWSPEIAPVTGDATYRATYKPLPQGTHKVTWVSDDGTEIDVEDVEAGVTPSHDAPAKEADAFYDYEFVRWSPEPSPITGDATYTAIFKKKLRSFTITWCNEDGSVIGTEEVPFGFIPSAPKDAPVKEPDEEHVYPFTGWAPTIAPARADAIYKATYGEETRKYTIKWLDDDGKTIDTTEVAYESIPMHKEPIKRSDQQYEYRFLNWTPAISEVTCDAEYKATYFAIKRSYVVTWKNWDGKVLNKGNWFYKEIPSYSMWNYNTESFERKPIRKADAKYVYTFTGWSPRVSEVTKDITYTAQYQRKAKKLSHPKGATLKGPDGIKYKVTKASKTPEVSIVKGQPKSTDYAIGKVAINKEFGYEINYKITSIGNDAFKSNTKLESMTIGPNVIAIGKNAFMNCAKLKSCSIEANVKTIGENAFKGCKSLKTIVVKSGKLTKASLLNMVRGSKIKTVKLSGVAAKAKKATYKKWLGKKYAVK